MLIVPLPCRGGLILPPKRGNPPLIVPRTGCQTGAPVMELSITSHGDTSPLSINCPDGGFVDLTMLGGGPPEGIPLVNQPGSTSTVFQIANAGTAPLNLGLVSVSDAGGNISINPMVTTSPVTPVAPAAATPFTVDWMPASGFDTADLLVSIPSNDPNTPYTCTIRSFVVDVI